MRIWREYIVPILNNLFKTEILMQLCAVNAESTRRGMSVQSNTKGRSRNHCFSFLKFLKFSH